MINNVFLFRNDLRIKDNIGFYNFVKFMRKNNENFIPLFIFDSYQILNDHFSYNSFNFLIESLYDLNESLLTTFNCKLFIYILDNKDYNLNNMLKLFDNNNKINNLGFNLDYSPYSLYRDEILKNSCINLHVYENNNFLNDKELYLKSNKSPYEVFGAYLKHSKKIKIREELKDNIKYNNNIKLFAPFLDVNMIKVKNKSNKIFLTGGRKYGLQQLSKLTYNNNYYLNYQKRIDKNKSMLSAYLKFGCLSIVEVYNYLKKKRLKHLIEQLHWRNFYMIYSYKTNYDYFIKLINSNKNINFNKIDKTILSNFEQSYYNNSGDDFFNKIKWDNNYDLYKSMWIDAKTGYPLIDASVICLKETGFLTNRSRLLLAYFSSKILHINPFDKNIGGQIEFSKHLIDCCYSNNLCNWRFSLTSQFDNTAFRFGAKGTKEGRTYDIISKKSFDKYDPDRIFINKWLTKDYFDDNGNYIIKPIVDYKKRILKWRLLTKMK